MGWRIETDDGETIEGHRFLIGDYTSMESEYYALLHGLHKAKELDSKEVTVLVDCEPLVRKMRHFDDENDVWHDRKEGFDRLCGKFEWANLEWIPRSQNEDANTQASIGLRKGRRSATASD